MVITKLNQKIFFFSELLSLGLIATTVLSVILRYVFRYPNMWFWYLSIWIYGSFFALGGGYLLYIGGHTSVDVLFNILPNKARKIINVLNLVLISVSCGFIFINAASQAWFSISIKEVDSNVLEISPPIWWYKCILVLSVALLALQSLSLLKETISKEF